MAKENKQKQESTQQSSTQPWSAAIPLLGDLINKYSGIGTDVTPGQAAATGTLSSEAAGIPSFGSDIYSGISKIFGADTQPQIDLLKNAYGSLGGELAPLVDPANLDPYKTPGFSDAISTAMNDITNKVKGVYAGSGRDPSGAGTFAKTLGRGLTEGIAPTIANQFNANVGHLSDAAKTLFGGAGTTAGGITSLAQIPLSNIASAIGLIPSASGAAMAPGAAQLSAEQTKYNLPFGNLAPLLQAGLGLGSLGQQSQGTSTTTTSQPQSTLSNVMGGILGGTGILSNLGAFGPTGWLLSASDERVKDNVEEIGKLHDGQPVYRFTYKDEPNNMRIGLLAQDVLESEPDAVYELPDFGILAVEHKRATDRAASIGRSYH